MRQTPAILESQPPDHIVVSLLLALGDATLVGVFSRVEKSASSIQGPAAQSHGNSRIIREWGKNSL